MVAEMKNQLWVLVFSKEANKPKQARTRDLTRTRSTVEYS